MVNSIMEIKEIINKQEWETFLAQCSQKTFLQSWNWGVFQKSLENKIWRFGIYSGELVAVALVIKHIAKRGSFLLVPHGPVFTKHETWNMKHVLEILLNKLKELAKEERTSFIRVSPIWERTEENNKIFKDLGFRLRPLYTHPESSWKLDIDFMDEELFTQMRKTTRYLIKQAQKDRNIEVFKSVDPKDVDSFNAMHLEVVKKQAFVPFSLEYFKKEFSSFLQDDQTALFFVKYNGQMIAAAFEIFWSGIGFYHHAALLPKYRNVPASYLLQWEAIKEARERGCKLYDFWGYIDPVKYPKHPYAGPTLFKMGFGGYRQEYVKTQDFIISKKYWLNYIIETMRRIKRGL